MVQFSIFANIATMSYHHGNKGLPLLDYFWCWCTCHGFCSHVCVMLYFTSCLHLTMYIHSVKYILHVSPRIGYKISLPLLSQKRWEIHSNTYLQEHIILIVILFSQFTDWTLQYNRTLVPYVELLVLRFFTYLFLMTFLLFIFLYLSRQRNFFVKCNPSVQYSTDFA